MLFKTKAFPMEILNEGSLLVHAALFDGGCERIHFIQNESVITTFFGKECPERKVYCLNTWGLDNSLACLCYLTQCPQSFSGVSGLSSRAGTEKVREQLDPCQSQVSEISGFCARSS